MLLPQYNNCSLGTQTEYNYFLLRSRNQKSDFSKRRLWEWLIYETVRIFKPSIFRRHFRPIRADLFKLNLPHNVVALITKITGTEPLNDTFIIISLDRRRYHLTIIRTMWKTYTHFSVLIRNVQLFVQLKRQRKAPYAHRRYFRRTATTLWWRRGAAARSLFCAAYAKSHIMDVNINTPCRRANITNGPSRRRGWRRKSRSGHRSSVTTTRTPLTANYTSPHK